MNSLLNKLLAGWILTAILPRDTHTHTHTASHQPSPAWADLPPAPQTGRRRGPPDIPSNHTCKYSEGFVNITTYKYTEENPGYHAFVCEGCGETHNAQHHTPKYEEWTYNNDQTFIANGTESNVCSDCGTILTRDTFGTADFNETFSDMHFFKVIFEYINMLIRLFSAI